MEDSNMLIGVEEHISAILDIIDRLAGIIEAENKKILLEGQAQAVLRNKALQESKLNLYQKFETLARIIGGIARNGELKETPLVKSAIPRLLHMRRMITVNSLLLQSHIEQQLRMMDSIMAGIEAQESKPEDSTDPTPDSEQSLCR